MHTFDCEAMNTTLTVQIDGTDFIYAKSAAFDCFEKTRAIEDLLSMYKFGSDISMLNSSKVGALTKLTDTAMECLMMAFKAGEISGGAIDVCMGEYFLKAKSDDTFPLPNEPRRGQFAVDPENYLVKKISEGRIDLGAIGKGFAVDKMAELLTQTWEIKSALISFGNSSIYAIGAPEEACAWDITLAGKDTFPLRDAAIGASGTAVQGAHIIDARTGKTRENMPLRTWAMGASAAMCDAMSTAFMLLDIASIAAICSEWDMVAAIQQSENSPIEIIE